MISSAIVEPGIAPATTAGFEGRSTSAVSWGAIFAGAAAAASLSLILLILGAGLGFSAVSPWAGQSVDAATLGMSAIAWLAFTQLAASGVGGYLAGRLRTKWAGLHTDEVYFRDTAHGLLAWSVATLVTAALLTSAVGSVVGTATRVGASAIGGVATAGAGMTAGAATAAAGAASAPMGAQDVSGYFVDSLFRRSPSAAAAASAPAATADTDTSVPSTAEVGRIFASATSSGSLTPEDTTYVATLVAQRTGLSQADAEKRVSDTFQKLQAKLQTAANTAREAADKARKASAYGALWMFVALLLGAFVASLSATWGGRQRNR